MFLNIMNPVVVSLLFLLQICILLLLFYGWWWFCLFVCFIDAAVWELIYFRLFVCVLAVVVIWLIDYLVLLLLLFFSRSQFIQFLFGNSYSSLFVVFYVVNQWTCHVLARWQLSMIRLIDCTFTFTHNIINNMFSVFFFFTHRLKESEYHVFVQSKLKRLLYCTKSIGNE